jgi:hypothetical protein
MSAVENFLRRWSTVDITPENAILFEEHLIGVKALATKKEEQLLKGLTRATPRVEFAQRYRKLLNEA